VADALHTWLRLHRQKVPSGSATAEAIDYSLGRWAALTRYLDDGALPADNNWAENSIRPIALARNNWLFKDVLEWLPTQPSHRAAELLPHRWTPQHEGRSVPVVSSANRELVFALRA